MQTAARSDLYTANQRCILEVVVADWNSCVEAEHNRVVQVVQALAEYLRYGLGLELGLDLGSEAEDAEGT